MDWREYRGDILEKTLENIKDWLSCLSAQDSYPHSNLCAAVRAIGKSSNLLTTYTHTVPSGKIPSSWAEQMRPFMTWSLCIFSWLLSSLPNLSLLQMNLKGSTWDTVFTTSSVYNSFLSPLFLTNLYSPFSTRILPALGRLPSTIPCLRDWVRCPFNVFSPSMHLPYCIVIACVLVCITTRL